MTHSRSSPWTTEQQDEVARMLAAGLSFSRIADEFDTTRNAIAGVIHRNRILQMIARPAASRPSEKKVAMKKPELKLPPPPIVRPAPGPPPIMRRVGLVELRRMECRWSVEEDLDVIGHHRFCGAPTPFDQPYCPHHTAIAVSGRKP